MVAVSVPRVNAVEPGGLEIIYAPTHSRGVKGVHSTRSLTLAPSRLSLKSLQTNRNKTSGRHGKNSCVLLPPTPPERSILHEKTGVRAPQVWLEGLCQSRSPEILSAANTMTKQRTVTLPVLTHIRNKHMLETRLLVKGLLEMKISQGLTF